MFLHSVMNGALQKRMLSHDIEGGQLVGWGDNARRRTVPRVGMVGGRRVQPVQGYRLCGASTSSFLVWVGLKIWLRENRGKYANLSA